MKGVTSNGFEFEVDKNVADNMELLDAMAAMDDSPLAMSKVCRLILDDDQRKRLYDHLRTEDGRVPVQGVSTALVDIVNSLGDEGKNS